VAFIRQIEALLSRAATATPAYGLGGPLMDDSNSNGIVPDAADDHSAVLGMLASESWQKRLDEARKAREAVLAQRGHNQDLPARLKSAAPRQSPPPEVGPVKGLRGPFAPAPANAGVETPEAEEEFPEFFPEIEDDPPVVHRVLAPVPTPSPSAHIPEVEPPPIAEPVPPAETKSVVANVSRLRRPFRIAAGFGLGLAAGVAATSLAWMMIGPTGGPAPRTEALPPLVPVVVPQTAALTPPDPTPPMLTVSTASVPPDVAFVLADAVSPPAMPPNGPEVTKIELLARLSGSSDMPANPAPQAPEVHRRPDSAPAPRPAMQASVTAVSFAPRADQMALLPAAFALPAAQSGMEPAGAAGPDPAPSAIELPPAAPQVNRPDPAEALVASAPPPPRPETVQVPVPVPAPGALGSYQVNVMAPESVADVDLTATITGLQGAGFQLGDSVRVSFQVSKNHVRFYHATDRTAAEALAERIGGEARDFTESDVNPPEGMIELWLQGSGQTVAAAKPAKEAARPQAARAVTKEPEAPPEDSVMKSLRDKIVRQLQQGEHL
jgi:hypothetical protein